MKQKAVGQTLVETLETRFKANMQRHPDVRWEDVKAILDGDARLLAVIDRMEQTGGEPDVVLLATDPERLLACDCSPETPAGRYSLCYDRKALDARKANKPAGNAVEMAADMGISLLNEEQYRALQAIEPFDQKTSSWIATPEPVRTLGGALFCDRRFGRVFTYHNGAESYYSGRGFRGCVAISGR